MSESESEYLLYFGPKQKKKKKTRNANSAPASSYDGVRDWSITVALFCKSESHSHDKPVLRCDVKPCQYWLLFTLVMF